METHLANRRIFRDFLTKRGFMKKLIIFLSIIFCSVLSPCYSSSPDYVRSTSRDAIEMSDKSIALQIKDAIRFDIQLSADAKKMVRLQTVNGTVIFSGQVKDGAGKMEVEKIARSVRGVKTVENKIQVIASPTSSKLYR